MAENERSYLRFPLVYRIEHMVLLVSFTTLAITGLVQKYAGVGISQWTIAALGGIQMVRIIHRIAAVILMLESVFHIGRGAYNLFVLRRRPTIVPTLYDIKAGFQAFMYNLRLGKTRPQQGRYTFEEKVEYWAVVWGTVVMAITGFFLWNPIATTRVLPGEFIPAAKEVHGGEALLAVLAIIVWHMYHVHLRSFNKSMFTGYLSEEEMREEHPLELADIKAGLEEPLPEPEEIAKRRKVFFPVMGLISGVLVLAIIQFATFERTAIDTIPRPQEVVFAPLTPTPFPTPLPTATPLPTPEGFPGYTWEGGISAIFQQKCSTCHGNTAQLGGLNISTYTSTRAGGDSGPGVVPGDPDASQVIIIQEAGGHPAMFTDEELELIRQWIEAGAPEN
jgi:cytochrome b subunit of formate dehydrogenase